jgi:hypothetical protein
VKLFRFARFLLVPPPTTSSYSSKIMLLLRRAASRRCLLQSSSARLLAQSPVAVSRRQKVDYIPSFIESRKSLTKIIATIGPASEQFPELQACVKSG